MAIGPEVEFRRPSVMASPLAQLSPDADPPVPALASSESPPQPLRTTADTARMPSVLLALPTLMFSTPPHVTT